MWIVFGFIKRYTFIRRFGLGLSVMSVAKLFLIDLYDLSTGNFQVLIDSTTTPDAQQAIGLANDYLDNLVLNFDSAGLDNLYRIVYHPDKQDLIIKFSSEVPPPDPPAVPEPGTFLLIGSCLLGILGIARKYRQ